MSSEPTAKAIIMDVRGDATLRAAIQEDPIKGLEQAEEQAAGF